MKKLALLFLLAAAGIQAQKKEILDMSRDVALLQEQVRAMEKSQNDRLAAIESALKTMLDTLNSTRRSVTVLDSGLKDRMEKSVVAPVSSVGAKVDTLQEEFRYVRENVGELNQRMGKLQQQVIDLGNIVKAMQAPPPPPAAPGLAPTSNTPPPGVTAEGLYRDAMRDRSAGNLELALKQFTDYLAWFGESDLASNAQFYIGDVYYAQQVYDQALTAFDAVLEKYPKNAKTLDARFMKGRTLVKLDRRDEGAEEFREIIRQAPSSPLASRARAELKSLGLSAPAARPKRRN